MDEGLLSLKWNNHKTNFLHLLSGLREKEAYTDATLACEGKFFPVHKFVMSMSSDYFRKVFEKTTCKSPVIILKDIKEQDLDCLLNYMYLGEVDVRQADLANLIKAAECLQIKGLAVSDEHTASIADKLSSDKNNESCSKKSQTQASPENMHYAEIFESAENLANPVSQRILSVETIKLEDEELFTEKQRKQPYDADFQIKKNSDMEDSNDIDEDEYEISRSSGMQVCLQSRSADGGNSLDLYEQSTSQQKMRMKTFRNESELNDETWTKLNGFFICKICSKTFTRKPNLKIHVLRHTGKSVKHSCPHCPYKSDYIGNVRVHARSHSRNEELE